MSPAPPKCAACPLRGEAAPCYARTVGHARFCELIARGRKGYREIVLVRSGEGTYAPAPAPEETPRTIPLAESTRRLARARACPSRTAPQCGCAGMATCLAGKGRDGQVSLSECVACVAEEIGG